MWEIILGHNPFFGVHHGSTKTGMLRSLRFQDPTAIVRFVEKAFDAGIKKMMLSTHPRAAAMRDVIVGSGSRLQHEMTFYPLLPYMQKYVRAANENGIFGMLSEIVSEMGLAKSTVVFLKAGISKMFNNTRGMLESLIAMEMSTFRGLQCDRVFLHNALTDLALGLNMPGPIEIFKSYVENKLHLRAGFCTWNLPFALRRFAEWRLNDEYFMAPFNKLGHQMNPNLATNQAALEEFSGKRITAMSSMASGQLDPWDACEYLARFSAIDAVVIGISSEQHLRSTLAALSSARPYERAKLHNS